MPKNQALAELKDAIRRRDAEAVEGLLRSEPALATSREDRWTPLQDTAFAGDPTLLRLILKLGSGITAQDVNHAVHHAVQLPHGNLQAVEALLETGLIPEPFAGIYRGEDEAMEQLAANPALADARDPEGCPPLLRAAEGGHVRVIARLLDLGVDPEARTPYGQSTLAACACNQIDVRKRSAALRLLLERGADPNGRTWGGRTPLFSAATAGWHPIDSVKILLQYGADPQIRNDEGRTVMEELETYPRRRFGPVRELLQAHDAR